MACATCGGVTGNGADLVVGPAVMLGNGAIIVMPDDESIDRYVRRVGDAVTNVVRSGETVEIRQLAIRRRVP